MIDRDDSHHASSPFIVHFKLLKFHVFLEISRNTHPRVIYGGRRFDLTSQNTVT